MRKHILLLLLTFTVGFCSAQFEPSKEEIKKYEYLLKGLAGIEKNGVSDTLLQKVDKAYFADSNSIFLKGLETELNMRVIYRVGRLDRVPFQIGIVHSLIQWDTAKKALFDNWFSLAGLYKYAGDFKTSIIYYDNLLKTFPNSDMIDGVINNLAATLNIDGQNARALKTIRLLPNPYQHGGNGSLAAQIYLKNGMLDSAYMFADSAIQNDTNNYSAYTTKAKVLIARHDKYHACLCIDQAEKIIAREKAEEKLNAADKKNKFVSALLKEIAEVHQLKRKNCID